MHGKGEWKWVKTVSMSRDLVKTGFLRDRRGLGSRALRERNEDHLPPTPITTS